MRYAPLFAIALAACAAPANANLVTNGGFEVPVLAAGAAQLFAEGSTIGSSWTVLGTSGNTQAVYVLQTIYSEPGNLVNAFNSQEGFNSVDLNGAFNQGLASGVRQTISTTAGQTYRLTFYVGRADGNGLYATPSTVDLSINGGSRMAFTNANSTPNALNWQLFTTDFVGIGSSTTLDFFNGQTSNNFSGLDDVVLTAVPEPRAWLLLGAVAAGAVVIHGVRRCTSSRRATSGLMAAMLLLAYSSVQAELVVNGGFEVPAVPGPMYQHFPNGSSALTGWTVGLNSVEIHVQGYVGGSGTFSGPAFQGTQWLDLDGFPSPGSISQTLATSPGGQYALRFAYANNPFRSGSAQATVYVQNSGDNADLMTPLSISHGTATSTNYDWQLSGLLNFVAAGSSTNLLFVSNDGSGDGGVFLDAISVTAVPEARSLAVWSVLAIVTAAARKWKRSRAQQRSSGLGLTPLRATATGRPRQALA